MKKHKCPCCEYYTLTEEPPGTYEICKVCFWEDDDIQYDDPTFEGGANEMSLNKAKKNYLKFGAISEEYLKKVRPPLDSEKEENQE